MGSRLRGNDGLESGMTSFTQLERLAATISAKSASSADSSYTAQLLAKGIEKCAKKFGEEAVELALATVQGKRDESTREAADVLYHFLVLLEAARISPDDVMAELKRREGTSGITEKASRPS
jgi:phosphoribosyl-ATP pyrophosphohydrolase